MTRQTQMLHKELTARKGGAHKRLRSISRDLDRLDELLVDFGRHPRRATKSNQPRLDAAINKQVDRLLKLRENDLYWNGELDGNAGLGAEYIMMLHFLGIQHLPEFAEKARKLANYTRQWQTPEGHWAIYAGGPGNLSYSVICYFGLKLAGDSPDAPHMAKARAWILKNGGALQIGVEQRLLLALFGQYDWAGVAPIPPWLVLLPHLPMLPRAIESKLINIYDLSYWCRVSLVPMSVLYQLQPLRKLDPKLGVDELFLETPEKRRWDFSGAPREAGMFNWGSLLNIGAKAVKRLESLTRGVIAKIALNKAQKWILDHQDDSGDWGGIYPPIMYGIMALTQMGMNLSDPRIVKAFKALDRFMIYHPECDGLHMEACVSPVWDTAWALYALGEAGFDTSRPEFQNAIDWLYSRQILRDGDWAVKNPGAIPGGWCFQFYNDFYPDVDDSAVVLQTLLYGGFSARQPGRFEQARIGVEWLLSMQNDDGGWSAFECGVDKALVNHIPFNDLSNMLDPSTADLTGHMIEMLGHLGYDKSFAPVARGIAWLKANQETAKGRAGSWWGRWGVNYVYGTWSALTGLAQVGEDMGQMYVRRAVDWLYSVRNPDGGWGESCDTYRDPKLAGRGPSTPSQTSWALLGLIAAGEQDDPRVRDGIDYLLKTQLPGGGWDENYFTGTGFPNAFYLNYHFYREYFPLLALARYRNAICGLKAI
ncbi:MAG: squalene--hopene cyclase [Planctomycetes bacterium]|nr:squalene--hopene cyclase [Planctomycetota bacterium]